MRDRVLPDSEKKGSEKWWNTTMCYSGKIAEGNEDVLKHGIATLKVDGTNGYVFEFPDETDPQKTKCVLYRRQDPRLNPQGQAKQKKGEKLTKDDFLKIEGNVSVNGRYH